MVESANVEYVLPVPPVASVAVAGTTARFAVRRIFCVGRNYAAHAREMGRDPTREAPFFFLKPHDAVIDSGARLPYPPLTADFQHEIELVVAIGEGGADIALEHALAHVWGYGVGIDLTRRDLQIAARDQGRPWDWGKAFDRSAPCAPLRRVGEVGHPEKGRIWLSVNHQIRQNADLGDLIWSVPEIIESISCSMSLAPGDLIFTGTPAGVGPLVSGDTIRGGVEGIGEIVLSVGAD
jgi:fumarylpyruvate hydrolase